MILFYPPSRSIMTLIWDIYQAFIPANCILPENDKLLFNLSGFILGLTDNPFICLCLYISFFIWHLTLIIRHISLTYHLSYHIPTPIGLPSQQHYPYLGHSGALTWHQWFKICVSILSHSLLPWVWTRLKRSHDDGNSADNRLCLLIVASVWGGECYGRSDSPM